MNERMEKLEAIFENQSKKDVVVSIEKKDGKNCMKLEGTPVGIMAGLCSVADQFLGSIAVSHGPEMTKMLKKVLLETLQEI